MSQLDYQALIRTAGDPWPTWAFVVALIALALALGAIAGAVNLVLSRALAEPHRITPEERRGKLLKLISSTERERHR